MPLLRAVDLSDGESAEVRLHDGTVVSVKLLGRKEIRDSIRQAVRVAQARLEVDGEEVTLECATYRLPKTVAGVQIDCTITSGYLENSRSNPWSLEKDVRVRLWPASSPLMAPGTYRYPAKQRWFATTTQMANEPSFVDGSELPSRRKIYYHYGLDIGGAEGIVEVISATDGLVVVRGKQTLPEYENHPAAKAGYDVVGVLDDRGWYHGYFHLASIDPGVVLGERIKMGEGIGLIGKEGSAGCWSHLHYEIRAEQPSGKWGIQEGYAFLWEAYQNDYSPEIIAVARPHHFVWVGEPAKLDGSRSWSHTGNIQRFEWTFSDGSSATGPTAVRVYQRPGTYSEVLKVTDSDGHTAYDFAVVQVFDKDAAGPGDKELPPPTIHATYTPTLHPRVGEPITFLVRTCRTVDGHETWNFGDGSAPVSVTSDGCAEPKSKRGYARTEHVYAKPGDYLVRVERTNKRGESAVAHLHVRVEG
jgi:murein DD-endopeptidase MepM/ murein hydrolase activator NlpD